MEPGKIIAVNLKKLRTERNLSLGALASISGISKTMLSDIEKGNSNPTINTVWKIANGLKVPYTKLIDGVDDETTIVQRKETIKQTSENNAYRVYCYYTTTPTRNFELFYCELDAKHPIAPLDIVKNRKNIFMSCRENLYWIPKMVNSF